MRSILLAGVAGLLLSGGAMAQMGGSMGGGTSAGSMSSQGSMGTPGMSGASPGMMPATGANDRMPQRDIPGEVSRGPAANAPVNDRRHMREAQSTRSIPRRSTRPEDQAYMGGGVILENGRPVSMGGTSLSGSAGMMGPSGRMMGDPAGMAGMEPGSGASGSAVLNRGQDPRVGINQVQPGAGGPVGSGINAGRPPGGGN
ncbi:MAG: hypothetical protein K2X11_18425 [Acetobacteraceae bacterium]|nr:hypothetical protein [Acetobacteraceae bacterium]